MSIWYTHPTLDQLNGLSAGTMVAHLGIEITELGPDFLAGRMPVDPRTIQPAGVLHGGASVALAESLGSIAAHLTLDHTRQYAVGMEINANHIRPVRSGMVTGVARPVHLGATTQVWEIRIINDAGKLVCISRLTLAVLNRS